MRKKVKKARKHVKRAFKDALYDFTQFPLALQITMFLLALKLGATWGYSTLANPLKLFTLALIVYTMILLPPLLTCHKNLDEHGYC